MRPFVVQHAIDYDREATHGGFAITRVEVREGGIANRQAFPSAIRTAPKRNDRCICALPPVGHQVSWLTKLWALAVVAYPHAGIASFLNKGLIVSGVGATRAGAAVRSRDIYQAVGGRSGWNGVLAVGIGEERVAVSQRAHDKPSELEPAGESMYFYDMLSRCEFGSLSDPKTRSR